MRRLFKIIISGPNCSGKTTLLHLLDGEKNLVNFYHDKILDLFSEFFLSKKFYYYEKDLKFDKKIVKVRSNSLKKKIFLNIPIFKKKLYNVGYASLEDGVFYNEAPAHYSIKSFHKIIKHEINFNFQNFDERYKNFVFKNKKKNFSYEEIIDFYIKSFQLSLKRKKNKKLRNFVFKSPNTSEMIKYNITELKNAKFIYVKRDLLGLIKSRAMDKFLRDKHIKKKNFQDYFKSILFSKYIENIYQTFIEIDNLEKKYKNKLYVTSIEKIIYNKEDEMKKILNFLNLEKKENYFKPTYNQIQTSNKHINSINDNKIFVTKNLLDLYNLRTSGIFKYIKDIHKISFKIFCLSIYIKIKNFII